ncbi:hypothetical protein AVEN_171362-1 [Araneus ventricosus]|uniref:Uncharacterized protein n=1 Tax=Araneus ventricosus TaxID=182803 RepID=A0A4Y2JVS2_ARAVE|nr:hypothetical protein AVEN_171362-1 [Araneus ventricosus]
MQLAMCLDMTTRLLGAQFQNMPGGLLNLVQLRLFSLTSTFTMKHHPILIALIHFNRYRSLSKRPDASSVWCFEKLVISRASMKSRVAWDSNVAPEDHLSCVIVPYASKALVALLS